VHATNALLRAAHEPPLELWDLRGLPKLADTAFLVDRPLPWIVAGCFFAQTLTVRRRALESVGGFTVGRYYEDMDLCTRLLEYCPWCLNPRPLFTLWRRPDEAAADKPLEPVGIQADAAVHVTGRDLRDDEAHGRRSRRRSVDWWRGS
jgi:hypothetical protein